MWGRILRLMPVFFGCENQNQDDGFSVTWSTCETSEVACREERGHLQNIELWQDIPHSCQGNTF